MKNDQVVARRILAGDLAAKEAWIRWNLVASMRVAPANFDWSKPWDGTRA
jgi:hypothetical protein